ncbi:hypothetical protein SEA_KRADAL_194 [Streptomyces phage Kradal]|nr:hypothetical protein SEA_KRADAL_194 [Streptomyces phage Kradal]QPL14510.1 hypothetical protein SEA_EHYELIMAYOE_195 [Streptomyces phage EhyElimayoE]
MTYVEEARERLVEAFPKLGEEHRQDLLDLYTLLVLIRGEGTTAKHVHNAWSVRTSRTRPDHWSIVPFEELSPETQGRDVKYAEAIQRIARELENVS